MFKVLLAVSENWDAISEIPFLLKSSGCTVHVVCQPTDWVASNSFVDELIVSKKEKEELVQQIIALSNNNYDWIILADDPLIKLLNEAIQSNSLFDKIMPLKNSTYRKILGSKAGLSTICNQLNILTPEFIIYDEANFIQQQINTIHFPVLLKQDLSWGGMGITICNTKNDILLALEKIDIKTNLVIQQYINGEDVGVEALFWKGELICCNISKVLSYINNKFSISTRRVFYYNEIIKNELQKIGKAVGLHGFASVGFFHEEHTNKYYLLEIDIRPNSWMPYGKFTGNDFAEGIKKIIAFEKKGIAIQEHLYDTQPVEVALFYKDLKRCLYKWDVIGISYWLLNIKNYKKFIPTYDTVLYARIKRELKKQFITKRIRKIKSTVKYLIGYNR